MPEGDEGLRETVILFCHFYLSLNLVCSIKLPSLRAEPGT